MLQGLRPENELRKVSTLKVFEKKGEGFRTMLQFSL